MYARNHVNRSSHPLRSFSQIPVKQRDKSEWKAEFDNIEGKSFTWVCPWYESKIGDIIGSCGKFPNVPLMGPRGCISYTPAVVLKQLCWTQKVPREEQLGGLCFWYKDDDNTKMLSKEVREAWGDVRMAGRAEYGKPLVMNMNEYVKWREERRVFNVIPGAVQKKDDHSQSVSQIAEQLEILKAQMQFLEQQKRNAELEVVIAQSKCEKMAREIEHLKDDCADMAETSRTRRGKEKMSEPFMVRIQELEENVKILSEEKYELKKEIHQRGKMGERLRTEAVRHKQKRQELERKIRIQSQANIDLEEKVVELTSLLEITKIDRD